MLSAVVIVCLVVAVLLVVYAGFALPKELEVQREVKNAAQKLSEAVGARMANASASAPQVETLALGAGTDFVKALATLGESLSKLRSGTSALLLAFGILIFAGIAAGVDDKIPDAAPASPSTAGVPAPQN